LKDFENIYRENYQKMYCVALKMINDKDAVFDILQDVFMYYYQKSTDGYVIHQPKSWLFKATINKCIDYGRRRKRYTTIDGIDAIYIKDDETDKSNDKIIVTHALSKLKTREKTLILLYGEGMSYKEIAEIAHIKLTSVGKMLSRTLKKIDEIIKKLNHEMYS
jgi:RNA polymerase sigma-70 factor (ECF subfamily)